MRLAKYGYGIVDADGNPYWSESCVCQDKVPMLDVVQDLNEGYAGDGEGKPPFRVIALYRRTK